MRKIEIGSIFELNHTIDSTFFSDIKNYFDLPEELKVTHIKALIIIKNSNQATMSQISHKLDLVKGAFTPVANRLIEYGYIIKVKSDEDKRVSYLDLTPKGSEFVDNLLNALSNNIVKKLSKLSEEEQEAYLAAIKFVLSTTKKIAD